MHGGAEAAGQQQTVGELGQRIVRRLPFDALLEGLSFHRMSRSTAEMRTSEPVPSASPTIIAENGSGVPERSRSVD